MGERINNRIIKLDRYAYLFETNVSRVLTEALTAEVEAVLADKTGAMGTGTAMHEQVNLLHQTYTSLLNKKDGCITYHSREPFPKA